MGPPIVEGKHYTLVIDRDWPDARGVPMAVGFRKTFRGGPAERNPPDPKQWRMTAPRAGASQALLLNFPTPMNYPLLQRMLHVSGAQGNVAGTVSIDKQETEWRFIPQEPWKPGDYQLIVDIALEDLAGNHVGPGLRHRQIPACNRAHRYQDNYTSIPRSLSAISGSRVRVPGACYWLRLLLRSIAYEIEGLFANGWDGLARGWAVRPAIFRSR